MMGHRTRMVFFALFLCLVVSLGAQVASAAQFGPIFTTAGPGGR